MRVVAFQRGGFLCKSKFQALFFFALKTLNKRVSLSGLFLFKEKEKRFEKDDASSGDESGRRSGEKENDDDDTDDDDSFADFFGGDFFRCATTTTTTTSSERQRSRVLEKKGLWRFNDFFRLGEVSSVVFVVVVVVGVVDAESFE